MGKDRLQMGKVGMDDDTRVVEIQQKAFCHPRRRSNDLTTLVLSPFVLMVIFAQRSQLFSLSLA